MRKPEANDTHRSPATAVATTNFTPAEEQALEAFGAWMDGALEQLVSRWIHLAAPNASRRERATRRGV